MMLGAQKPTADRIGPNSLPMLVFLARKLSLGSDESQNFSNGFRIC